MSQRKLREAACQNFALHIRGNDTHYPTDKEKRRPASASHPNALSWASAAAPGLRNLVCSAYGTTIRACVSDTARSAHPRRALSLSEVYRLPKRRADMGPESISNA